MPTAAVGTTWPCWVTTTSTTASSSLTWNAWVMQGTTTGSLSIAAWTAWNGTGTGMGYQQLSGMPAPPLSDRDRRIRETRQRASDVRARVARRRAELLLLDHLDDIQREEWREGKSFHVETAEGRRRYRIRRGLAGNVELVRDGEQEAPAGQRLRRYCMHVYHPDGRVPDEDNVLAQKLILEANEAEFLRLANAW